MAANSSSEGSGAAAPPGARAPSQETNLALLDGAEPKPAGFAQSWDAQRQVVVDSTRSLEERLEAFEDIFESEVGDTILSRGRNIEREVGLRQIWMKFEGDNPSGTQKDRIAFAQAMDALRRGFEAITVATCGNYGVALAFAASVAGLRCLVYIPEKYQTRRVSEMEQRGAEILRGGADYEQAVALSRERASRDEMYDANPGSANTALQLRAYGEIAYEIYDELRDAPAAVAVPVSNGTTLAGIYHGFVSLYRRGKTSRLPRMIAGSSFGNNPILLAFQKKSPSCEDLPAESIRETAVNEPLINWHSIDGDLALDAVRRTGGWARAATDRAMGAYARLIREHQGLSVLPASTAGLIALVEQHRKEPLSGDRYVAVLTGRRA